MFKTAFGEIWPYLFIILNLSIYFFVFYLLLIICKRLKLNFIFQIFFTLIFLSNFEQYLWTRYILSDYFFYFLSSLIVYLSISNKFKVSLINKYVKLKNKFVWKNNVSNSELPYYMNGTLPLTRNYIAERLLYLEKKRDKLSTIDKKFLDEYQHFHSGYEKLAGEL